MDNALLALYGWFTLALFVIVAVAPLSSSAVAMALWSALSLALSAHIAWRRLHWVPVEGEPIVASQEAGGPPYPPTYYRSSGCGWRWTYGGVTYTAEDYTPGYYLFVSEKRTTLWVDPRDPSRLLPPTWRARLSYYLSLGIAGVYETLCLGARALGLSWGGVGGLVRLLLGG